MLYPMLNVLIMPVAAFCMDRIGISNILLIQSILSFLAAITENRIILEESIHFDSQKSGFCLWLQDLKDGFSYLKGEKGLLNIYAYDAVANGSGSAMGPILGAFFRTAPGFSAQLYGFFSAAEFIGRTIGGFVCYHREMDPKNRRKFVYFVQQLYNVMDALLLWIPYPWMLVNRAVCGFLGINSATVRMSSIHQYLPETYRARVNAFSGTIVYIFGSVAAILLGAIGEIMDYRMAISLTSGICMVLCALTVGRNKKHLDQIYLYQS
jgi:MFS family permease